MVWLVDCLVGSLGWWFVWSVGWLFGWLVGWVDGLVGWSVVWVGWWFGWSVAFLVGWLVACIFGWFIVLMVVWLYCWFVGWLFGWLLACLVARLVGWMFGFSYPSHRCFFPVRRCCLQVHTSTFVPVLAVRYKPAGTIPFPRTCAYKSVRFVAVCGKPLLTCGVYKEFQIFHSLQPSFWAQLNHTEPADRVEKFTGKTAMLYEPRM